MTTPATDLPQPVSMQRAVSCAFIPKSGGYAVRIPRGAKVAESDWDPRSNTEGRSRQVLADIEADEGTNIGCHFHGRLVDVAIDTDDAERFLIPALDRFLPACPHVWGRPSRPRSHRAYLLAGDAPFNPHEHPIIRRLKAIPEVGVDVRGGPAARGEYTLLPGSQHPSGELYEWADLGAARGTPAVAALDDLLKAIRLAGSVAVMAPHWVSEQRHAITLAFAGFLHRIQDIGRSV